MRCAIGGRNVDLRASGGYTLLEMALVLIFAGLFLAAAIPLYDFYRAKIKYDDTVITQKHIDQALTGFKGIRGRYPCPARGNRVPGDPDYGLEVFNCTTVAATIAPGSCLDGLCIETGARTRNVNGTAITPLVIRGTIPFRTLRIPEDKSFDEYGGKFSYAVTSILTDKPTFRVNNGAIDIVDNQNPPVTLLQPQASAHYFVFSHGPDGVGAYNRAGIISTPCDGPMYDNDNCRTTPASATAIYRHSLKSEEAMIFGSSATLPTTPTTSVNRHYDDFADYVGIGTQPMWEVAEDTNGNLLNTINLTTALNGQVFMGRQNNTSMDSTGPRSSDLRLQVEGTIRVPPLAPGDPRAGTPANPNQNDGRIDRMCDQNSGDCMPSALLGARNANDPRWLRCNNMAPTNAGNQIHNSVIECGPPRVQCPSGELLRGFDSDGLPLCGTAGPRCPSEIVRVCGQNQALPNNGRPGDNATLTGGASYQTTYRCVGGEWTFQNESGVCTCTPNVTTRTSACPANMGGLITTVTTRVCPSGQSTSVITANTCVCVPSVTTRTENCPAGFNGNITYTTRVTCNGNTPVSTTTQTNNTCQCVSRSETRQQNCPSGFTGQIQQRRTTTCPANTWGPWQNQSNNCQCAGPTTTNTQCPAGYNAGQISERCTYTCNNSTLTSSRSCTTTNNCSCVPSTATTTEPCPSGFTGNVRVTTRTICPGATRQVTRDDSACQPVMNSCTVTVIDNTVLSNSRQTYAAGDRCTGTAGSADWQRCTSLQYCHRTLGAGLYTTHRCSCQ